MILEKPENRRGMPRTGVGAGAWVQEVMAGPAARRIILRAARRLETSLGPPMPMKGRAGISLAITKTLERSLEAALLKFRRSRKETSCRLLYGLRLTISRKKLRLLSRPSTCVAKLRRRLWICFEVALRRVKGVSLARHV